jgi:putative transposase
MLVSQGATSWCSAAISPVNGSRIRIVVPATAISTVVPISRRDWAAIAKDLKPVYTAATKAEALDRFAEFAATWETRYPAIIKLWESAWPEFTPFLAFDRDIRTVITITNAIKSLNARFRRSVKARGHFATEQAALKHLYLVIISLDPTGRGRQR